MTTKQIVELKVPSVGESVTEVEVGDWLKQEGESVARDESVVVLETDKATMEVPAPAAGTIAKILKRKGDRVAVGDVLGKLEPHGHSEPSRRPATDSSAGRAAQEPTVPGSAEVHQESPRPNPEARVMPAAARLMAATAVAPRYIKPTGPGGRVLKEDVKRAAESKTQPPTPVPQQLSAERAEEVVPMSLLRRKIAERLVQAQQNAALLTTFNEVDMSTVIALRREHQERFQQRYDIKLGFMSFFLKAVVEALKETPQINAEIRGTDIVYRDYFDIGVAIGGGRGLVVPVLRNAQHLSFAEIEQLIAAFARKARENRLRPDDLEGGTFTITNGGVYGSMLSTPLINPPQSGVLGMHAIQDRPTVVNGQVVIRPMMYLALTYDHRLVDGREAVTFLRRVKDLIEDPVRMLVEV